MSWTHIGTNLQSCPSTTTTAFQILHMCYKNLLFPALTHEQFYKDRTLHSPSTLLRSVHNPEPAFRAEPEGDEPPIDPVRYASAENPPPPSLGCTHFDTSIDLYRHVDMYKWEERQVSSIRRWI